MKCFNITLPNANICDFEKEGVHQQVVFIRKTDISDFNIDSKVNTTEFGLITVTHDIHFALKPNVKGYRLNLNDNSSIITATFAKSEKNGLPKYNHKVTIGINGNSAYYKWFLKQFDLSNEYFIAVQRKSGLIEIYGFHNGFKSDSYDYENSITLTLTSLIDENDLPYIYKSSIDGNEILDFDYNFDVLTPRIQGDFNNDYNNDYNNKR